MTKGKGKKTMNEREQPVFEALQFVGVPVAPNGVRCTHDKDIFNVILTETLTQVHIDRMAGSTYEIISGAPFTSLFIIVRKCSTTSDDTQALEATQVVAPAEALPTLPDTGHEGTSEAVKTIEVTDLDTAINAAIEATPKAPCQHPEYARHKSNGTEVCRLCGEVVKSINGYEDVGELKRQNAELRQQLETADAVISKYLDRIMQLERALEPTRAAIAAKTQTTLEFRLFTCELKLDQPETLMQAAGSLAVLVNAGWRIAFEAVEQRTYIVRLERWVEPNGGGHETTEVDTLKAEEFPEPPVDAVDDSQPIVVDMPEPEPAFTVGQRVVYNDKEATIQELGRGASVHILIDRPDGRQEARWVYIGELKRMPEPVPTLALDASGEDAPKVEAPAHVQFAVNHPRINPPGAVKRFGHLEQWQMAGRAGQKVTR